VLSMVSKTLIGADYRTVVITLQLCGGYGEASSLGTPVKNDRQTDI